MIIGQTKATVTHCFSNPELPIIKPGYPGNQMADGTFIGFRSRSKSLLDILKWKFSSNPKKEEKANEAYALKVIKRPHRPDTKEDHLCWLGHATFLIQIDGKRIITDPCLTAPPLTRRHTELPFGINQIDPHYLLISHGHYDHLDSDTIEHFDHAAALVPLKMSDLLRKINPTLTIQEAGWYQQYRIAENFEVYFLPSLHWHRRGLSDTNEVLWGSYILKTPHTTLYFAGDTAYGEHFKEIGALFDIDIAILPIGAYAPRWFMGDNHMDPQDALKAFHDLKAKTLLPMHYGTFDLTDEPMGEPEQMLRALGTKENVRFVDIGEIVPLG